MEQDGNTKRKKNVQDDTFLVAKSIMKEFHMNYISELPQP